jgi:hypothetical protein
MAKLDSDPEFDMTHWINEDFFAEVWLSLSHHRRRQSARAQGNIPCAHTNPHTTLSWNNGIH